MSRQRWSRVTWALLILGAVHLMSVLAVLPVSGLHPAAADVVAFAALSLVDIGLVLYARRALRELE